MEATLNPINRQEMLEQARYLCQITVRALAIRIIAHDRRIAERRQEVQHDALRAQW